MNTYILTLSCPDRPGIGHGVPASHLGADELVRADRADPGAGEAPTCQEAR